MTISEKHILDIRENYREEAKYIPDEWSDFHHHGLFEESEKYFEKLHKIFRELHPKNNDHHLGSSDAESEFADKLYNLYQSVMVEFRKDYPLNKIPFCIVHSFDCGRSFITDSVLALNTGTHKEKAFKIHNW